MWAKVRASSMPSSIQNAEVEGGSKFIRISSSFGDREFGRFTGGTGAVQSLFISGKRVLTLAAGGQSSLTPGAAPPNNARPDLHAVVNGSPFVSVPEATAHRDWQGGSWKEHGLRGAGARRFPPGEARARRRDPRNRSAEPFLRGPAV